MTTATPLGWAKWEIDGAAQRLTWEAAGGRTGARCVKATGVRNGCFIQSVPVQPGQSWFTSIWVRSTGSPQAVPQLVLRWREADGVWTADEKMLHVSGEGGADR